MIKNLIFDWGGVVLTLDKDLCIKNFADVVGVPDFNEYLTPYLQKGFFAAYENGDITDQEFVEEIKKISNRADVGYKEVEFALDSFLKEIPQYKVDLINELAKKYNLYILSNNNPICWRISERMFDELSEQPVKELFKQVFLSYRLNLSKPGKEIFLKVIEQAGFDPGESLFIDDAPANVETAASVGFKTLFYDVDKNLADELARVLEEE
jgi:putative hydrolase of the HAD superfamily